MNLTDADDQDRGCSHGGRQSNDQTILTLDESETKPGPRPFRGAPYETLFLASLFDEGFHNSQTLEHLVNDG